MSALELAVLFHVIYERKSAEFNYVTRQDTRIFDPESPNGKLMIAVCDEIMREDVFVELAQLRNRITELEKAKEEEIEVKSKLRKVISKLEEEYRVLNNIYIATFHSLDDCEDNLKSMVEQYCRTTSVTNSDATFSHDYMGAGECTFEYLVKHGIANWCGNGIDIYFPNNATPTEEPTK